jgi:hypothetical protein
MQYEAFRAAFYEALRESRLTMIGQWGSESLDLRNLDRTYEVYVHAVGARKAEPFWPSAKLSFRWVSLTTARTATNEADTLIPCSERTRCGSEIRSSPRPASTSNFTPRCKRGARYKVPPPRRFLRPPGVSAN